MGLTALQGYLAFSPLPEENWDEELDSFAQTMSDPAYRLPTTTAPTRYEVTLSPYLATVPAGVTNASPFTFDGTVAITIRTTQANVNEIVLHCNDLTISALTVSLAATPTVNIAANQAYQCQMPWSFLRIPLTATLQVNQDYVIRSTFRGNLQTNMRGFYRSWYIDRSGQRRYTQFRIFLWSVSLDIDHWVSHWTRKADMLSPWNDNGKLANERQATARNTNASVSRLRYDYVSYVMKLIHHSVFKHGQINIEYTIHTLWETATVYLNSFYLKRIIRLEPGKFFNWFSFKI